MSQDLIKQKAVELVHAIKSELQPAENSWLIISQGFSIQERLNKDINDLVCEYLKCVEEEFTKNNISEMERIKE